MVLHVEGMTLPGNQSRLGKNTGRSLTLGEMFNGKYLWDHLWGRSEIGGESLKNPEVFVGYLTLTMT